MYSSNNLDRFINDINESEFSINSDLKNKVLNKTFSRLCIEDREKSILKAKKSKTGVFTLRNIAAACLAILIINAFIPNSPVNALYEKIFSFIPGVGVIENESGDGLIKCALNKSERVMDHDEFLEVKSAYITSNSFHFTINTNIGTNRIKDIKNKEEVLKYFSGETMPGIYLLVNGQKVKLENYSTSSLSLETKTYTINGYFYIDKNTPPDALFQISMDGFDKTVAFKLSPVKNGITPESMGSTITVHNIMIFANTDRSNGIVTVNFNVIAPKSYRGVRFSPFDHEKALFPESVSILDKDGVRYQPDEELRKQNNSGINTFYFRISDNKEVAKIVIPQILYSQDYDSKIKMSMPRVGEVVHINKEIDLENALLQMEEASLVPKEDSTLPDEFKRFDCLKIGYSTSYKKGSNTKILRIIPDIQVPDTLIGYVRPSSSVYSELCPLDKNEGYAILEFENMDKTKRIMINLEVELAVIGPFEMDINN